MGLEHTTPSSRITCLTGWASQEPQCARLFKHSRGVRAVSVDSTVAPWHLLLVVESCLVPLLTWKVVAFENVWSGKTVNQQVFGHLVHIQLCIVYCFLQVLVLKTKNAPSLNFNLFHRIRSASGCVVLCHMVARKCENQNQVFVFVFKDFILT